MRNITISRLLLVGMLQQGICHAADTDSMTLQTNPFLRPTHKEAAFDNRSDTISNASAGSMQLRGIMLANSNSVVNIDGEIIAIGQQIHGYTLISVKQRHIVLDRNGTQITLSIDNESSGND